ncbi:MULTISPECIES: hypothetical protein [Moorena]|uniref:hypothetical protein n=1 Tax=Moorena TaxID=1155738 RepID=UPI0018E94689|nr:MULTISPECIES: hypothetical protein [Moorena]
MVIVGIQTAIVPLLCISDWTDVLGWLNSHLPIDGLVLAQTIEDPDVLGQIKTAWQNFIDSGQAAALVIGLVVGYLFRNLTSFN